MTLQNRLLVVQMLAVALAVVGELAAADLLVTAGVVAFFVALAALFVQMTAAFVTGLSRTDGRVLGR
jgi:hypothetical protein